MSSIRRDWPVGKGIALSADHAIPIDSFLGNMGVGASPPVLARFHSPVDAAGGEQRWLEGLYLDTPEEWDDPYRFFRW